MVEWYSDYGIDGIRRGEVNRWVTAGNRELVSAREVEQAMEIGGLFCEVVVHHHSGQEGMKSLAIVMACLLRPATR